MYILARSKRRGGSSTVLRQQEPARAAAVARVALTGLLVLLAAASSEAQQVTRQVLVLQSLDRGNLPVDQFTGNFRVELDQRAETPGERRPGHGRADRVRRRVRTSGGRLHPIHLRRPSRPGPDRVGRRASRGLRAQASAAASFPTRRSYSHPSTNGGSVTLRSATRRLLSRSRPTIQRVIDDILQLLPQTRQVVMVVGSGQIGQFWHRALEKRVQTVPRPADICLAGRSIPSGDPAPLCEPATELGDLLFDFGTDATGAAYADERVFAELHATANAPLFAALSPYLGDGIVGGSLISLDELARTSADTAIRLLNGAAPVSVRVPPQLRGQSDLRLARVRAVGHPRQPFAAREHRALSRSEPVERISRHGPDRHRRADGPVAADRRPPLPASRTANGREREPENLALAADANRRQTVSALAGSIAHELGQPLSAMIHNAESGRTMIAANRASLETVSEILSDIESEGLQAARIIDRHRAMLRSHQMEKKLDRYSRRDLRKSCSRRARHGGAADRDHLSMCPPSRAWSPAIRYSCSKWWSTW